MNITPELLREWLPLPLSAEIIGSRESSTYIAVIVDDPAIPECAEGAEQVVCPTFKKNVPVEFVEWGVRK